MEIGDNLATVLSVGCICLVGIAIVLASAWVYSPTEWTITVNLTADNTILQIVNTTEEMQQRQLLQEDLEKTVFEFVESDEGDCSNKTPTECAYNDGKGVRYRKQKYEICYKPINMTVNEAYEKGKLRCK